MLNGTPPFERVRVLPSAPFDRHWRNHDRKGFSVGAIRASSFAEGRASDSPSLLSRSLALVMLESCGWLIHRFRYRVNVNCGFPARNGSETTPCGNDIYGRLCDGGRERRGLP